jgi:hypothetical protein
MLKERKNIPCLALAAAASSIRLFSLISPLLKEAPAGGHAPAEAAGENEDAWFHVTF